MPVSPKRCQPVPVTNGSWSSVRGCRVSCSRSGGRQDGASLQDTRHPKHTRGLSIAGLVGHHGGATMERAVGERVNERAIASECVAWLCLSGLLCGRLFVTWVRVFSKNDLTKV